MLRAATGSTGGQPPVQLARRPSSSASASSAARTAGSSGGNRRSSTTARSTGPTPRPGAGAATRSRGRRVAAAVWNRATVNRSDGSARSSRWCGTRARCSAVGLAVPTSIPRYTSIESTETISAPSAAPARCPPRSCRSRSGRPGRAASAPSDGARARGARPRRAGGARAASVIARVDEGARVAAASRQVHDPVRARPRLGRAVLLAVAFHEHLDGPCRPARGSRSSDDRVPAAPPAGRTAPARPPSGPGRPSSPPGCPGRGEYWNVNALSKPAALDHLERLRRSPPRSRPGSPR